MLENISRTLSRHLEVFINLLHVATIYVILALSVASGYTTLVGMTRYIDLWIAIIITVSVQSIIVLSTFELSTVRFRAHKLRFAGLIIALVIGLTISINFSYVTFYMKAQSAIREVEAFNRMDADITEYYESIHEIKTREVLQRTEQIAETRIKRNKAELGVLEELPPEYRGKVGKGPVTQIYERQLLELEEELRSIQSKFREIDDGIQEFLKSWNIEISANEAAYLESMRRFGASTRGIDRTLSDLGLSVISKPKITQWKFFKNSKPPMALEEDLSLYLAVVIDFLTFIFASRIQRMPVGILSSKQISLVSKGIKEFTAVDINRWDNFQLALEKTRKEKSIDYCDTFRKFVIALLINKGFARRVDKGHVEFTERFYDIISSAWFND